MNSGMKSLMVLMTLAGSFSVLAENQQFECTKGTEKRMISVVYELPHQNVPCRVDYEKNGSVKTLWNAKATVGFCEQKANSFLDKQRGQGFACEQLAATTNSQAGVASEHQTQETPESPAVEQSAVAEEATLTPPPPPPEEKISIPTEITIEGDASAPEEDFPAPEENFTPEEDFSTQENSYTPEADYSEPDYSAPEESTPPEEYSPPEEEVVTEDEGYDAE